LTFLLFHASIHFFSFNSFTLSYVEIMAKIRVLLNFHRPKVGTLSTLAQTILDDLFGNPLLFPMPPIPAAGFETVLDTYRVTWAAYSVGGKAQQGAYRDAETALIAALDTLADYVSLTADGLETTITTSGFTPTKGSHSIGPNPTQPQNVELSRGVTRVLNAECESQDAALVYICIMTEGAPLPPTFTLNEVGQMAINGTSPAPSPTGGVIDFSNNRKKTFINLTVGVHYYFVFFVINARGVGSMSLPVSILCA